MTEVTKKQVKDQKLFLTKKSRKLEEHTTWLDCEGDSAKGQTASSQREFRIEKIAKEHATFLDLKRTSSKGQTAVSQLEFR